MNDQFVLDKNFCCRGLQNMVESAGESGIAILVRRLDEELHLTLQSRSIAFGDERKIDPNPNASDVIINISCEWGIQYCPSCGRWLKDLVDAFPQEYEDLAQKHRKFLVPI